MGLGPNRPVLACETLLNNCREIGLEVPFPVQALNALLAHCRSNIPEVEVPRGLGLQVVSLLVEYFGIEGSSVFGLRAPLFLSGLKHLPNELADQTFWRPRVHLCLPNKQIEHFGDRGSATVWAWVEVEGPGGFGLGVPFHLCVFESSFGKLVDIICWD